MDPRYLRPHNKGRLRGGREPVGKGMVWVVRPEASGWGPRGWGPNGTEQQGVRGLGFLKLPLNTDTPIHRSTF